MRWFRVSALVLVLSTAFTSNAYAWWNEEWSFRKELTFDLSAAGADIAGAPAEVPVLVRLSLANFGYFGDTKPDGSDLRFIASDDKTPLKFHVERYDVQAQMAFLWVRVPRLTAGANTDKIYLYYGNQAAESASDTAGTYDTNQALVYHFGSPAGSPQDATAYKTEPTTFNADVQSASLINAGVRFTGAQTISVPASPALRLLPDRGMTLSAWVRIEAEQQEAFIAALQGEDRELVLGIQGNRAFVRYKGEGTPVELSQNGTPLSTGEWHHLALRIGNGKMTLFADGADVGNADVQLAEIGGTLTLGGSAQSSNYLAGDLDELEVSSAVRPDEWLKSAARSQGMVAPLLVYGGDTQKESGSGGESYFGTTLRNVTVDGWVIIGILAVMFVVSILVMGGKAVYLGRVGRANNRFLDEFRRQSDDTALAAVSDSFGVSTLSQLYQHGIRETQKRMAGQAAGADRVRVLSPQAIEAIRATMDASLIRMTQKLNSQMVLLTIAISGGPFLGLLGTVVGVMITFAAIAVSGDVNINAIAPGTAAALVATVAGLGVAIPCLFGYNYLNTRAKEIHSDMRVFVDEFVTRIAETHS
jgi:biopolymer transport protein ExbB